MPNIKPQEGGPQGSNDVSPTGPPTEKRTFVIIGGGIIGCSIAYYLTHHPSFDPHKHTIIILEACSIASAASGKAGGFVGSWATPKSPNLGEVSFRLHKDLAKKYDGEKCWGFRHCHGWDVKWRADKIRTSRITPAIEKELVSSPSPPNVDWLELDVVESYELLGGPEDSAQVNPLLLTRKLAELAVSKGVVVEIAKADRINYSADATKAVSVTVQDAKGPWTTSLLPSLKLRAPRSHSIVVRSPRMLEANVLFPIYAQENSDSRSNGTYPEIYPRPPDSAHEFGTVYACGPDDHEPLAETSSEVQTSESQLKELRKALDDVSGLVKANAEITAQACYKPQLREHKENEDVGPAIGSVEGVEGLWVATGHDEWGVSNGPGTGLVMAEMLFDGEVKCLSGDISRLNPGNWIILKSM